MQAETIQAAELARAEARLPRWMIGLSVAGASAMLLTGHVHFSAGFALGAALSVLNYFWLHQAIETLFDAGRTRVPRWLLVKVVARYPLAFGGVYLFYWTGWLPFQAILAGLFVPVGGVLMEAMVQIGEGLRPQDTV